MSAHEVVETARRGWRQGRARLHEWSVDNRLREWVAGLVAVSGIIIGGQLIFDGPRLAQTFTYSLIEQQVRLHWVGIAMVFGSLLVLGGFRSAKEEPNGFAFAGGITLAVFYGAIALSVSAAVSKGVPSVNVSAYSALCFFAVLVAITYRTRRDK